MLRIPVDTVVRLDSGNGGVEATAVDVSEEGLKIEIDNPPSVGPVRVKLVGLPTFAGEVRWQSARHVGVRLANSIPREYLRTWLKTHGFLH